MNSAINRVFIISNRSARSFSSTSLRCSVEPGKRDSYSAAGLHSGPSPASAQSDVGCDKLRNIGIIAHINAGKTTTTERMLYYAGSTDTMGDVDRGNTVTDYLDQERDRGITITSAAVSYHWQKHRVNLIDTPGHVDFTFEVEKSLSVLDGAVTILDSSAGVEAQTISVWRQAKKYNLPSVIFLNKCDKPQTDIQMCIKDLKGSLEVNASLIQLPVERQTKLSSIVDLIERNLINWSEPETHKGSKFTVEPLIESRFDEKTLLRVEEERTKLINNLCDHDEDLANHVIDCEHLTQVSGELIRAAIHKATVECKFCPVLIGSSFRYIGVQQLMGAILRFLPSPAERRSQVSRTILRNSELADKTEDKDVCALIFKIMHDKRLGPLSYLRVYKGSLERGIKLENLETGRQELVKRIYRPFADELRELTQPVGQDDIVIATGLTDSRTGDILARQSSSKRFDQAVDSAGGNQSEAGQKPGGEAAPFRVIGQGIIVPSIERLEPVYFCSIEARNMSHQIKLEAALGCMAREDPSFTYEIDVRGITTIRGMGKLHLEIARDRMKTEHGVDSILGPLQVSYRETIENAATEELSINRLINGVNNTVTIKLYVESAPSAGMWTGKQLSLDTYGENSLARLRNDHRRAIENGFTSALMHGPSMGYQVIDCAITLLDFKANQRCGLPVISSVASQCLAAAVARSSPVLLEPIMLLEIVAPKEQNSIIVSDLTSCRRGILISTQAKPNDTIIIRSHTPLATLSDYSEFLRTTTSGRAYFSIKLHSYTAMSELDKQGVIRL